MSKDFSTIKQVLNNTGIRLNQAQMRILANEAQNRYAAHLVACSGNNIVPEDFDRFVLEIGEQIATGTYDQEWSKGFTELQDEGCRKLIDAIITRAARQTRLEEWHQQYVTACQEAGLQAYALKVIVNAIQASITSPNLHTLSISSQVAELNNLIANYLEIAKRKQNPKWFAKQPGHTKPSKHFNKYAY